MMITSRMAVLNSPQCQKHFLYLVVPKRYTDSVFRLPGLFTIVIDSEQSMLINLLQHRVSVCSFYMKITSVLFASYTAVTSGLR